MTTKKFMYGVGEVKYSGFTIGYIEKCSFDLGGQKGEVTKVEAEQTPGTPVLVIPQSNGTISPTFNLVQLDYENLHACLGGYLHYAAEDTEKATPVGWTAPKSIVVLEGPWKIKLVSGQSILIPNALFQSDLEGKLALTEVAKVSCRLEPMTPADGGQPYGVFDNDKLPDEWAGYALPVSGEDDDSDDVGAGSGSGTGDGNAEDFG